MRASLRDPQGLAPLRAQQPPGSSKPKQPLIFYGVSQHSPSTEACKFLSGPAHHSPSKNL
jgi:hypothetical protein